MWQKIQTYLFVTLITILVWLYAEGENLKVETFSPEIVFVSPPGRTMLIEPSRPSRRVEVTLQGPNSRLQEVMRHQPIEIELNAGEEPELTVDLAQRLTTHSTIMSMGLNVQRVEPPTVRARVEEMRTVTLPIEVAPGGNYVFTGRPTTIPGEGSLTLPASQADLLSDNAALVARLTLENPTVNQQIVVEDVPLSPPIGFDGRHVGIEPQTVDITVTITQQTKQSQAMNLPILLLAPLSELAKYEVTLDNEGDPFLRNVVLEGPNAIIDEINQNNREIRGAELRLTAGDLEDAAARPNEPIAASVNIPTPEGVRVVTPSPPIKVRVVRRETDNDE